MFEEPQANTDDPEGETSKEIALAGATAVGAPTFTKAEKSLTSLGFFTPSSRRLKDQKVKRISFTREIDGKRVEASAEIVPSAMFGLPVTADQDKYLAFQKFVTDLQQAHGKVENPVRFKSAELLRLLNRDTKAGKNYKEISEWLDVMTATTIMSNGVVYNAGKKQYARDRFRVFDRAVTVGKELDNGAIADANYVWLSPWQLENINNKFLLPIDLDTYQKLRNHIAKALVPLIQIWLYASQKTGAFEKRYDELCEILNVQRFGSPSLILRQFKPSLDELVAHEYLEKWRIERTSDRKAYKIILFHGPKYYRDQNRRLQQKTHSADGQVIAESDAAEPTLPEPGRIAPAAPPSEVPRKAKREKPAKAVAADIAALPESAEPAAEPEPPDVGLELLDQLAARGFVSSVAAKLLVAVHPRIEGVSDYIEYWDHLRGAGKEVGPGLLYELIKNGDPLPSTFETSRDRDARKQSDEKRQRLTMAKQSLEFAYDEYRRAVLDRYITDVLPADEYERIVSEERRAVSSQHGLWTRTLPPETLEQMAVGGARSRIAESVSFASFDEFCRREARRILVDYNIDPTELGISAPDERTATTS